MTNRVGSGRDRVPALGRRAETDRRALHGRARRSAKLAVRRMGACAETRHYSRGNDHRIDRVCVLRAFLASGPGLTEASARQEMSRIVDSGTRPGRRVTPSGFERDRGWCAHGVCNVMPGCHSRFAWQRLSALADARITCGRGCALTSLDSPTPSTVCLGTQPLVYVKMNCRILIGALSRDWSSCFTDSRAKEALEGGQVGRRRSGPVR